MAGPLQSIIPGLGFINETVTLQNDIPGGGFVLESAVRGAYFQPDAFQSTAFFAVFLAGNIKTFSGLGKASTKTFNGLALASLKTWNGLSQ